MDVISTNTGGVEVVLVPIHHGTVMLQLKGKAIYIDPDTRSAYPDLPKADYIFFTKGAKGQYAALQKETTEVIAAPLAAKRTLGDIEAESVGAGLVLSMLGRRFYFTGDAKPEPVENLDAAFVCLSEACAKDPNQTLATVGARIVFPYRHNKRALKPLKAGPNQEIRLRPWY
jgi:hypothetical protein